MLIFIDDSGDPGFKLKKGSSKYFVIALVIFDDTLEAEKTAIAIKELRRELKFSDSTEFKFHKSNDKVKKAFLKKVKKFQFRIRALVIEKKKIHSAELQNNKSSFYSYAIKTVLQHNNNTILDANIKIDGGGNRTFRKSFLSYFKRQLNTNEKKVVKKCRLVDSKSNVLIQLADMVAGCIRRSYEDKPEYKAIIKSKIEDEWNFV